MTHLSAHEETLNGLTLKIVLDGDSGTECPLECDDAIVMAFYERHGATFYAPEAVKRRYDLKSMDAARAFTNDNQTGAEWRVFQLWVYDHSGRTFRVGDFGEGNPFTGRLTQGHAEFDTAQCGLIAVKISEIGDSDPRKACEQAIANYNDWANGNIYGYVIEDESGDERDSCWGFIGDHDSYVLEQGRDMLKSLAADHEPTVAVKLTADESALVRCTLLAVKSFLNNRDLALRQHIIDELDHAYPDQISAQDDAPEGAAS